MKNLFLIALFALPALGLAWCENNSDCPPNHYCSKHGVFVGNYCQPYPNGEKRAVEHYTSPENKPMNLPFSEAVRVGNTVYLAGQLGIPMGEKNLVAGGIEPETEQTIKNIGQVLKHFNLGFTDIVKCQAMLADISEWSAFNEVYKKFFKTPYPARSAFGATGLAMGARVELECIAVIPN